MDNIKNIVRQVIGDIASQKDSNADGIEDIFCRVYSSQERAHSKILGERKGKIFIYVDSPIWLYRLNMKKQTFLSKTRGAGLKISEICFKIGK